MAGGTNSNNESSGSSSSSSKSLAVRMKELEEQVAVLKKKTESELPAMLQNLVAECEAVGIAVGLRQTLRLTRRHCGLSDGCSYQTRARRWCG